MTTMFAADEQIEQIAASGFFDRSFYEEQSGRTFENLEDAVSHYIEVGATKGLAPSAKFDPKFYFRHNPDVESAGANPLVHFIEFGLREGRAPSLGFVGPLSVKPRAPSETEWQKCPCAGAGRKNDEPIIDIIVPVYRGFDDTLACLFSVLTSSNRTPFELIVINDCGPEPQLLEELRKLAGDGLFTLIENPSNLGFVRSVNTGMALHPDRDVLLLNSDTIVYGDWLDRLAAHARVDTQVGTITPWSNNATIMSYPFFCETNNFDLELDFADLDRLTAQIFPGENLDVPTGVGFCFFIRRALLDAIGLFDAERFGRGYGEENEFCLRAIEAGWRNVHALDVFVRHTGEVSFSHDASSAQNAGLKALLELYPGYPELIADFIASDPIKPYRERLDLERFLRWSGERCVLFVEHNWGGGTARHTNDLVELLVREAVKVIRLRPEADGQRLVVVPSQPMDLPNLPKFLPDEVTGISQFLSNFNFEFAHIHSLIGFHSTSINNCISIIKATCIDYDFTMHDYMPVCPRITMIDWSGAFCDTPSTQYCQHCIDKAGSPFGDVDVGKWQDSYRDILGGARRVLLPSQDVHARAERFFPDARYAVRPHPNTGTLVQAPFRDRFNQNDRKERVVGMIGAIGPHKGSNILLDVAASALSRELPLRFIVYGYTSTHELYQMTNVDILGTYREDDIDDILIQTPCDLMFFGSICPETFCYTLSIAMKNEIYPICFDIGAPADRLSRIGYGAILPLDLIYAPDELADILVSIPVMDMTSEARRQWRDEGRWESMAIYYDRAGS